MPYDQSMEFWTGRAFVFWKNFYHYRGVIPTSSPGEAVITLKLHLRDMGYPHLGISGRYDLATRMVVQAIQARHGIPVDGYVGPLTQIVLYNDTPSLSIPHLWPDLPLPAIVSGKRSLQAESGSSSDKFHDSMGARP
jgi:general secretion pathway protein A